MEYYGRITEKTTNSPCGLRMQLHSDRWSRYRKEAFRMTGTIWRLDWDLRIAPFGQENIRT